MPEPEPESEVEPKSEPDQIPLPTMTLARLAIDQGDIELAESTLRGVLALAPGNEEATRLLESLQPHPSGVAEGAGGVDDPVKVKVRKLRRWLDTVRLASERLDS
jgi:hypothetical protein